MLMSYYTTHFVSYNKYTDAKGMTDGKWGNWKHVDVSVRDVMSRPRTRKTLIHKMDILR